MADANQLCSTCLKGSQLQQDDKDWRRESFVFFTKKRIPMFVFSQLSFWKKSYDVCQRFPGCSVSALLHLNQFVENSIEHLLFILPTNKHNKIVLWMVIVSSCIGIWWHIATAIFATYIFAFKLVVSCWTWVMERNMTTTASKIKVFWLTFVVLAFKIMRGFAISAF